MSGCQFYFILELNSRCTCQVFPISSSGTPISEFSFTRTGLLGFIGPAGLIFVAGKMDGLMVVGGRRHNADDIVATALAVEPMKFVYRGRFVLFLVIFTHHWFVACASSFVTSLIPRTRRQLSFSLENNTALLLCVLRIAVFSITVLHDERIVVVAEQRPDSTEEDSFQWMSRVLQVHNRTTVNTHTLTFRASSVVSSHKSFKLELLKIS